ncbi:MAG: hypothetical protein KAJ14_06740, partial [Candidatus Omnitrophica bacterium]|nr:hypothetical protein [Candidatus Omnitrophota bacterium]
ASNLPAVYNNLGLAYSAVGNFRKANSSFKIALKVSPTYRTAIINFAKFLQKIKKYKEVISMLEGYLERKEDLEMREILARVYFSMGQYGKTEMILKRIIDNPFKLILSSQEYGRLYNNLGVIYHKKGNLLEAGKAYYMSEEQGGYNSPIIISNLIDLNFDKKNLEQAEKYIGILHKNFKEEKSYYYQMGRSRLYRGDLQDAIKFLLLSIEKHDNFLPAYPLLSCMYSERLEDYKSAIKLNEYGAKIFPKSEGIINNLAYNYLMVGDIAKAKTILNKIPDNECTLHLYATKGLLAIKEGDIKEGSRLYNLASKMAETLFGKDLRGQVLQKKNLELGKYYLSVGNKNEAKDHFSKAVTFNAKEKYYLEQAQALLKSL